MSQLIRSDVVGGIKKPLLAEQAVALNRESDAQMIAAKQIRVLDF